MPVNYGILRGKVINAIPYQHGTDHYQIEIDANGTLYRIAVDVYSQLAGPGNQFRHGKNNQPLETDRMVMFYQDTDYDHPVINSILASSIGFTAKENMDKKLLLDYIRYTPALFPVNQMTVVSPIANGSQNDLNDKIDPWIQQAKNNDNAEVFALGSGWDDSAPGGHPDTRHYFNPDPLLGIHDIHMNQGDTGHEAQYNGIWQDGGLFIHFKDTDKWIASFLRFQNQSMETDDNGNVKRHQPEAVA
jgi:uncharacterized protein YukJ